MSKYKKLIKESMINLGNNEVAKAEKILIKETNTEEIRFSWWKDDGKRFIPRPLDMPEEKWLELIDSAVQNKVLSQKFIIDVIKVLEKSIK